MKSVAINILKLTVLLVALLCVFSLQDTQVLADAKSEIQAGVNAVDDGSGSVDPDNINSGIANVINLLSAIVGVAAVVMIIIGGFRYITSGGDSNRAASARNTILYAVIGLIIVAFAQIIVRFVLTNI